MTEGEIIDKIRDIACCGEEFQAICVSIERLKAVTVCATSYCDEAFGCSGEPYMYLMAMFKLIEDTAKEIDSGLAKSIKVIIDTTIVNETTE